MTETIATGVGTRLNTYVNALNSSSSDRHCFTVSKGRRFYKVIDMGSVHAFIEITTGDVYKPAGRNAPAEHVRYRLMDDTSYTDLLKAASMPQAYAGGYLYIR